MAQAMEWVSRITVIAIEMTVFIWLGRWLDSKFGTSFLAPAGLVLGPAVGFWHLLVLAEVVGKKKKRDGNSQKDSQS